MALYFKGGGIMKQIFVFITAVMVLSGCGSSGSSGGNKTSSDINMVILESYTVYPGDQLIKVDEGTFVSIEHVDGQDRSTVVLVEGSAKIIRQ